MKTSVSLRAPRLVALLALAFASLSVSSISAQTTVSTVPVGAITISIAGGTVLAPAISQVAIPLVDTVAPFANSLGQGVITSFTATTITNPAGGWSGNLALPAAPWMIRITSGPNAGKLIDIVSNTANTITVSASTDLTTLGLTAGTSTFELVAIDTLNTLFPAGTLLGGTSAAVADNVSVMVSGSYLTYWFDSTLGYWRRGTSLTNRNDIQIKPDSGCLISRRDVGINLTFTGRVPTTKLQVAIADSGNTLIHAGFPTDTTLGAFAAQNALSNWRSGNSTSTPGLDTISVLVSGSYLTYYYDPSNLSGAGSWRRGASLTSRDSIAIPAGSPIIISRPPGLPGSSTDLVKAMPYSL